MMMRVGWLLLLQQTISLVGFVGSQQGICGTSDTFLDDDGFCVCNTAIPENPNEINIAGIFDLTSYDWGPDIFQVTVDLINQGWWDAIKRPEQTLTYDLKNALCDETQAVKGYWDLRTNNNNRPPHGIVGARCSGASISLARISQLEQVPQVSMASDSSKLTDDIQFPFFSRLVAPNDERGEAGALVAMLRHFGWERITILATDTQFSKDLANEFRKLWVGQHSDASGSWFGNVAYSTTIRILGNGKADPDSIQQALDGVPTDDPSINSRIILLVAHSQHAFKILEQANTQKFQPDSVWVGPSAWVGRTSPNVDFGWLPNPPGYLGVAPFRNRDVRYQDFLAELQAWQRQNNKPVMTALPAFAAETVDSIVAMTKAISANTPSFRDGPAIVEDLRELSFDGVSGYVQFTPEGDRKNPQFTVFNAQPGDTSEGPAWVDVGSLGTRVGSAFIDIEEVCFAEAGCGLKEAVEDRYPVPPDKLPVWVIPLILVFALLFVAMAAKYWRSHRSKRNIKAELEAFRDSVVGMRAAECDYVPKVLKATIEDGDVEQALTGTVTVKPVETAQWCWQETDQMMNRHTSNDIYGDPANCWIKYDQSNNETLEEAYQEGKAECSPLAGYTVNFAKMVQTKSATGFERRVQRVMEGSVRDEDNAPKEIDLDKVQVGEILPDDLTGEPQMVLVEGDVVQIATQRQDGWAFGTKLHHADEAAARQLVLVATGAKDGDIDEDANVFADTGWFPLDTTRIPSTEDIAALQKKIDTGALDPPSHWDPIVDKTVVQKHGLKKDDPEYTKVVDSFMSTLRRPQFDKNVTITKVERVQNVAMYQSFAVKLQTICYRETNGDDDEQVQRKARERFEKYWLWHGCAFDVVDKILQQGFNRSFCGKNATAYGKGVYFARDASYSAYPLYSTPDSRGNQHVLACRVVVGEYCRGKHDALTPDVRDVASQSLYDSTVGVLTGDTMSNPSIYVTYHDAQAYPEYLITFKTS